MQDLITSILEMSSPLLLATVLTFLGRVIKLSIIRDEWIPVILFIAGGLSYPFLEGWTAQHFFQGLAIGGAAVGLNQGWRQFLGYYNGGKLDTSFFKKSDSENPDK